MEVRGVNKVAGTSTHSQYIECMLRLQRLFYQVVETMQACSR